MNLKFDKEKSKSFNGMNKNKNVKFTYITKNLALTISFILMMSGCSIMKKHNTKNEIYHYYENIGISSIELTEEEKSLRDYDNNIEKIKNGYIRIPYKEAFYRMSIEHLFVCKNRDGLYYLVNSINMNKDVFGNKIQGVIDLKTIEYLEDSSMLKQIYNDNLSSVEIFDSYITLTLSRKTLESYINSLNNSNKVVEERKNIK